MEKTYQNINGRLVQDISIPRRYSRLFNALQEANYLTYTEAHAAIRVWREVKDNWGSEALNHCGGFQKALKAARNWHSRQIKKETFIPHDNNDSLNEIFGLKNPRLSKAYKKLKG